MVYTAYGNNENAGFLSFKKGKRNSAAQSVVAVNGFQDDGGSAALSLL